MDVAATFVSAADFTLTDSVVDALFTSTGLTRAWIGSSTGITMARFASTITVFASLRTVSCRVVSRISETVRSSAVL